MNKNKQLVINMFAAMIGLISSFIISFLFTPYLIENIGVESYGFFRLSNELSDYILIISFALNSMVARFITIKLHQGDLKGANSYFSSAFYSNIFLFGFLSIPIGIILINLEMFIEIPIGIMADVKLLFAFIFSNLAIKAIFSSFGSTYYVLNKPYLSSLIQIITRIIEVIFIISLYKFFSPHIMYMGISSLVAGLITVIINVYYKNKLLPNIKLNKHSFDIKVVKELVGSGIWYSINRLSGVLLDGLDLLITNLFLGPTKMAIVALAKTAPSFINTFSESMVQTFSPSLTILYAQKKDEDLIHEILFYMKLIGLLLATPIAGFIAIGDVFYQLWIPSQDSRLLHTMSIIMISKIFLTSVTSVLKNIFLTLNSFILPSLALLFSGIASITLVMVLLNITNLGIWIIIGVSVIITFIREIGFTPIYAAKLLKIRCRVFYSLIAKLCFILAANTMLFITVKNIIPMQYEWKYLILYSLIMGTLGYVISLSFILNKKEKNKMIEIMRRKLKNISKV